MDYNQNADVPFGDPVPMISETEKMIQLCETLFDRMQVMHRENAKLKADAIENAAHIQARAIIAAGMLIHGNTEDRSPTYIGDKVARIMAEFK